MSSDFVNSQTPEVREHSGGTVLDVHSIFYTLQGEGPYSGCPAVFVRLAGCNLQCPKCDTEYTQGRMPWRVADLVDEVEKLFPKNIRRRLVVLTGGEPLRQDVVKFLHALEERGMISQIETNGTFGLPPSFPMASMVICSPKAGRISPGLNRVTAYKYVLDADHVSQEDGLPTSILGNDHAPARPPKGFLGNIYVSPMDLQNDEDNLLNTQAAAAVCMKFGYILNLQVHKYAQLP